MLVDDRFVDLDFVRHRFLNLEFFIDQILEHLLAQALQFFARQSFNKNFVIKSSKQGVVLNMETTTVEEFVTRINDLPSADRAELLRRLSQPVPPRTLPKKAPSNGTKRPENPNLTISNVNWLDSNEFKKWTTSDAANSKNKVVGRIEFVRDCLLRKIDPNTLSYDN